MCIKIIRFTDLIFFFTQIQSSRCPLTKSCGNDRTYTIAILPTREGKNAWQSTLSLCKGKLEGVVVMLSKTC